MTRDRFLDAAVLVALAAATSAWCVLAGGRLGATFDEPDHVREGLRSWRTGSNKQLMTWGAMPLPIDAQTLPLYLWERGRGEPFREIEDLPRMLPAARAATLPFWWLLLFYGLRWGRALGGPWAGRLACGLLAADPNLLGHAALATTDVPLTGMVLAATYHFFVNRDRGWVRRVAVPGLLYGLALATKASALPYVPLLGLAFGLSHLHRHGRLAGPPGVGAWGRVKHLWAATARLRWDLVYLVPIGLAVTFAYCGCDWATEPTFVKWADDLPDGTLKDVMGPVSRNLPVFPNAGEGIVQQVKHNSRGHGGAFVAGEYHPRAVWYYFPVALSIKLADPTLVLLAAVLVLRPRGLLNPATLAVVLLLLFSLNTRVQIGVRLVFPLVAFLHVAAAVAVCRAGPPAVPRRVVALRVVAAGCLGWSAVVCGLVWPDGLRHTNTLWGGTDRGYTQLADSNYDWGQGLPDLAAWHKANGEPPLFVWYHGSTGNPDILLPPFRHLPIDARPDPSVEWVKEQVGDGYLAVSVTKLYATPDRRPETVAVCEWLKGQRPVARTGTFLIYKLR